MTESPLVVRVLIADAHPVVREALKSLLEMVPRFEVVGTASDSTDALALLARLRPDVVLLDTELPDDELAETSRRIKDLQPGVSVLLFTVNPRPDLLSRAIGESASGVMLKTAPILELLRAIIDVATGRPVLDRDLAGYLPAPRSELSEREQQVLKLLGQGMSNREISTALGIASGTAKRHVENISRKFGKSQRTALVAEAFRRGLLD